MLHRSATLSGALAALALAAGPALADAGPAVQGDGFATTLPAGWTSHDYASNGGRAWGFASPGATTNKLATPTPGGIGVTAWVARTAKVRRAPSNAVALVARLTGVPKAAKHVRVTAKPHSVTLAGAKAGTMTLSYKLGTRSIVQRDVAVRRGGRLYEIELDVDRANVAAGQAAFGAILAAWRFA